MILFLSNNIIRFLYNAFSFFMQGNIGKFQVKANLLTLCPSICCPPPGSHEVLNVEYIHSWIETVMFTPHSESYAQLA